MRQFVAIDSFAGAGGLSLGLMQAGWDLRLLSITTPRREDLSS